MELVTSALNWFVRVLAETEMEMNSVERIRFYSELETEPQIPIINENEWKDWPKKGEIFFDSIYVQYRENLPKFTSFLVIIIFF